MDTVGLGRVVRAARVRRRWRQEDLARISGVSRGTVSRLELGHSGSMTLDMIAGIAGALEIRIDLIPRWRGASLDRLLSGEHTMLQERIARDLGRLGGWAVVPELSFAVYGERGLIDLVGWHPSARALLIVEVKTQLVDVAEVLGTLDRKRRLAPTIVRERGWRPDAVGVWLAIAESPTNRRHVAEHAGLFGATFTAGGRELRRWLRWPEQPINALSFLSYEHRGSVRRPPRSLQRVRRTRAGPRPARPRSDAPAEVAPGQGGATEGLAGTV